MLVQIAFARSPWLWWGLVFLGVLLITFSISPIPLFWGVVDMILFLVLQIVS